MQLLSPFYRHTDIPFICSESPLDDAKHIILILLKLQIKLLCTEHQLLLSLFLHFYWIDSQVWLKSKHRRIVINVHYRKEHHLFCSVSSFVFQKESYRFLASNSWQHVDFWLNCPEDITSASFYVEYGFHSLVMSHQMDLISFTATFLISHFGKTMNIKRWLFFLSMSLAISVMLIVLYLNFKRGGTF